MIVQIQGRLTIRQRSADRKWWVDMHDDYDWRGPFDTFKQAADFAEARYWYGQSFTRDSRDHHG